MFSPTLQPSFHIVGGPMLKTRLYSRYTALLVKAEIAGLLSERDQIHTDAQAGVPAIVVQSDAQPA